MANNEINRLLQLALCQTASEAFLKKTGEAILPEDAELLDRLQLGNTHATKFMPVQAAAFLADYEVLEQYTNVPDQPGGSGFSGTLFRNRSNNELVLSFRSTEFIDDAVRDGMATNYFEIAQLGWAFGQITEMEAWYSQLRANGGLLAGKSFLVIGNSLGGHLATAFNILRREEYAANPELNPVIATYTFNGAGTGAKNGRLTDLIAKFNRIKTDFAASPEWGGLSPIERNELTAAAEARIAAINEEQARIAGLRGVQNAAFGDATAPGGSQQDLGYQIAALLTAYETVGALAVNFPPTSLLLAPQDQRFANMTEVVGMETNGLATSFVSNGGIHYGARQEVHIEDQPAHRGDWLALASPLVASFLVDDPSKNDFADTHSLILIVDSLSLMAAMEKLAPALTIERAGEMLAAMSNAAGRTDAPTQGKAEGDTLERMLDALRKIVLGPGIAPTLNEQQMRALLEGNTWHDEKYRAPFHSKLTELRALIEALVSEPSTTFPIDSLVTTSAEQLAAIAGSSEAIAYRYALKELNPFAVVGETAREAFYNQHNLNAELDLYDPVVRAGEITTEWLTDRAAFQSWRNLANVNNTQVQLSPQGNQSIRFTDLPQKYTLPVVPVGAGSPVAQLTRQFIFGGERADALAGNARTDRLYGGAGADFLIGRGDSDYLEGGKGLDVYQYHSAAGILGGENDGHDIVRDIDGRGVLRYTYSPLLGIDETTIVSEASDKRSDTEWRSANGKFIYTKTGADVVVTFAGVIGGGITLKDFRDGDFGIHLRNPRAAPQSATRTFYGDKEDYDSDPSAGGIQPVPDGFGNNQRADGVGSHPDIDSANREDLFHGSAAEGEVELFLLGGGNDQALADGDQLYPATGGVAWMQGGGGRDMLHGGPADDLLEGGADGALLGENGGDTAFGGFGNDEIYGDAKVTLAAAVAQGESGVGTGLKGDFLSGAPGDDLIVGSASNDYLDGGSGSDLLLGGLGDDDIAGDYGYGAITPNWVISREIVSQDENTLYRLLFVLGTSVFDSGPAGDDVIYAGNGDDWIFANAGEDHVDAADGNDVAFGEAGADVLIGGAGDDRLIGDNPGIVLSPDEGADVLDGGTGNDELFGNGGDDILFGGSGNDTLYAGAGNDVLAGGEGSDTLVGGAGKDTYVFNRGDGVETVVDTDASSDDPDASVLVLGDGILPSEVRFGVGSLAVDLGNGDVIHFEGFDRITPNESAPLDRIEFVDGSVLSYEDVLAQGFDIDGTEFDDSSLPNELPNLVGTGVTDRIRGFGGDDVVFGLAGDDMLDGGDGDDLLVGGAGADTIYGGSGADAIWGAGDNGGATAPDGADVIHAGDGHDYVEGADGADEIFGEGGDDTIDGQAGSDVIDGGDGNDALYGDGVYYALGQLHLNLFDDGAADVLRGGGGNDYLNGAGGDDLLDGGEGNDQLLGESGNDTLFGEAGDDTLLGGAGDDVLSGGSGRDSLQGQDGNDTYLFGVGDGEDFISEQSTVTQDIVRFGAGIAVSDIRFSRGTNNALVAWHVNGADQVTIQNWYTSAANKLDLFAFEDASQISAAEAEAGAENSWRGGSGNDSFGGSGFDDTLYGLDGNDSLSGGSGNDVLIGGAGMDYLFGGNGIDTYRFALGHGSDTITDTGVRLIFEPDIAASDITYARVGNDLAIRHQNGVDSVQVTNWFSGTYDLLSNVAFEGTAASYLHYEVSQFATAISHQYALNIGDGTKVVDDWGGIDTLTFGSGIAKTDIQVSRSAGDLTFAHSNGVDRITIKDWFNDVEKQIENFHFSATGETYAQAELTSAFLTLTGTAANDVLLGGEAYGETFLGLAGNDTIYALAGDDFITGGLGNDTLYGGSGLDRYYFKAGDGADVIYEDGSSPWARPNVVQLGPGLVNSFTRTWVGGESYITFSGSNDRIDLRTAAGSEYYASFVLKFELNGTSAGNTLVGSAYGDIILGLAGNDTIQGSSGEDEIDGGTGADIIDAGEYDDVVHGGAGNDTIEGGWGYDLLWGDDGDDVIYGNSAAEPRDQSSYMHGGAGNDTLYGGDSIDTYYYSQGDGADLIIDRPYINEWNEARFSLADRLLFGPNITAESLFLSPLGNDLLVRLSPTDQITIRNWISEVRYRVDEFVFSDGSKLDANQIMALAYTQWGSNGNDTLTGTPNSDALYGLGGNDTLIGNNGHDLLDGGSGNDTLDGGSGDDRYVFGSGSGQDRIIDSQGNDRVEFAAGISASQIAIQRTGNSLALTVAATSDTLTVENFLVDPNARIEMFVFSDGSSLPDDAAIVSGLVGVFGTAENDVLDGTENHDVLYGYGGNDTLNAFGDNDTAYGGDGDDILNGGPGSDDLQGEGGNDTYNYALGGGFDVLSDVSGFDVLHFGAGIAPSAVTVRRSAEDLVLNVNIVGNAGGVTATAYFNGQEIEEIRFSDGALWDVATVLQKTLAATAGDDTIYGMEAADTINSLAGNDTVYGRGGNDVIDGGPGSDRLYGEDGDDLLMAGSGDAKNASIDNYLYGGNGSDALIASSKGDWLDGGAGNDILRGGADLDSLWDGDGSNVLFGAASLDFIYLGDGNDIVLGGTGNDRINGDSDGSGARGRDIVAFNKSDGADTISRLGADSTISIGGATTYSNLSFAYSGNDLLLKTGSSHYLLLTNWYGASAEKTVSKLQIVIEGTSNYNAKSSNPLNNKRIQTFDFLGLVAAYDAAGRPGNFSIASNLATHRIGSSDTEAIGGAIAYQYARTGNLDALSNAQMKSVLDNANFGIAAQPIIYGAGGQSFALAEAGAEQFLFPSSDLESAATASSDTQEPYDAVASSAFDEMHRARVYREQPRIIAPASSSDHARLIRATASGMALASHAERREGSAKADGHASAAWADDGSLQIPRGSFHHGDEVRRPSDGLGSRALDNPTSAAEADESALLFDRLARKPSYDFETLAAFFEEQSARQHGLLTGQQIAARWSRVQTYTRSNLVDAVADDLGASADWAEGYLAGYGRQDEWHIPVRAAVGIRDSSAAALRLFDGIQGAVKSLG